MKALSILGTSSNAGKSWMATAFCALLRRRGYRVAPFKAQNMSNNSFVTLEGGEIGRAQAAQAEACGMRPIAAMNPILLKPSGDSRSQLVVNGEAQKHIAAADYYQEIPELWTTVRRVLDSWKSRCDVLVLEGAGSPVELNLMHRDIVNLRPIEYLGGRWLLTCDIERGGVFAQAVGTVNLMPKALQSRGLGLIVNKFRGDPKLFSGAANYFKQHIETPYLGVLPFHAELQPENEDGYSLKRNDRRDDSAVEIAWIAFPHVSNSQDAEPWLMDVGVSIRWIEKAEDLKHARAIVLPGSKNTLSDLAWLRKHGLDQAIQIAARQGVPILGICGGFQMLGQTLNDATGIAGIAGCVEGLKLLPHHTVFEKKKRVSQVTAHWECATWSSYEIHMGRCVLNEKTQPLIHISDSSSDALRPEGIRSENIWGTYLHGFFESAETRKAFCAAARIHTHQASEKSWDSHKQTIYQHMADLLEKHLDLNAIFRYLDS